MNIILMGCPGAGKGTQAVKLQQMFHLHHISTGDVLRAEIASGSPLGKQIAAIIDKGNLVPDEMIISMLENSVKSTDKGIIFDGFPRTVAQAQALDEMMHRLHHRITHVVMIELPQEEAVRRITSRRQCKKCGEILHIDVKNPLTKCPVCGGELYARPDDTPARAKHRFDVYRQETLPVKNYYQSSGKYVEINGYQEPQKVFEDIEKSLKKNK
ncbi:MAG: adenylate kinase [Elusimicrobiaceae bacterium]|nr:adenylate kinase [Elusimicrobiaceae bacterium]